jgi:hypothetical protein
MFKSITAFHRVKYPDRITIKDIIKNFNQVGAPVKTDKQMFVFSIFIVFKVAVVFGGIDSPSDIGFGNAMVES